MLVIECIAPGAPVAAYAPAAVRAIVAVPLTADAATAAWHSVVLTS